MNRMGIGFPAPDWVMCGVQNPAGGVRLLASQDLTQAELQALIDYPEIVYDPFPVPGQVRQRFLLTAEMRTFSMIEAPDYPAAFQALFEHWSPQPAARAAIGEGQMELGQ